ncbi:hypothetical protein M445_05460 [Vibrio owensii 47666-1]|uniref:hypothetical protein n=1 Tax=Vibrio owensii TaxID=696485 RepID=UPI000584E6AD|nr:hypothetical protein [Vibrio owensii]KIF48790.1 hypothetical protein M445_05460 [Vibrio owensii 47666-1]
METKVLEYLETLCIEHINNSSPNQPLVIDVSVIKKKIHNDFLEDVFRYLESKKFNAYYCSEKRMIFAFPI